MADRWLISFGKGQLIQVNSDWSHAFRRTAAMRMCTESGALLAWRLVGNLDAASVLRQGPSEHRRSTYMAEETNNLIELTADIVSSHVTKNSVSIGDLPNLIQQVHQALASLGQPQQQPEGEARTPAVTARASIKSEYLICMECGSRQRTLKRHLRTAHGMTPQQYREAFALKKDYPMVAPAYSERRSEMAKLIGLGSKRRTGEAAQNGDALAPKKGKGRKTKDADVEG